MSKGRHTKDCNRCTQLRNVGFLGQGPDTARWNGKPFVYHSQGSVQYLACGPGCSDSGALHFLQSSPQNVLAFAQTSEPASKLAWFLCVSPPLFCLASRGRWRFLTENLPCWTAHVILGAMPKLYSSLNTLPDISIPHPWAILSSFPLISRTGSPIHGGRRCGCNKMLLLHDCQ